MLEAGKQFRRVNGQPHLPALRAAIEAKVHGAALYRLRAEAFGILQHHGGVSPAWPIGYDEMDR